MLNENKRLDKRNKEVMLLNTQVTNEKDRLSREKMEAVEEKNLTKSGVSALTREIEYLRSEVDKENAFRDVRVVVAERVVEGDGGGVDDGRLETAAFDGSVQVVEVFRADRDDTDFEFTAALSHQLVIPDSFREREGDRLLGFEADDFVDLVLAERGKFDEFGDEELAGDGIVHWLIGCLEGTGECANRIRQGGATRTVSSWITGHFREGILLQQQGTFGTETEARHADALRSQIKSENRFFFRHRGWCLERRLRFPSNRKAIRS